MKKKLTVLASALVLVLTLVSVNGCGNSAAGNLTIQGSGSSD